jgi:hypothetical protein
MCNWIWSIDSAESRNEYEMMRENPKPTEATEPRQNSWKSQRLESPPRKLAKNLITCSAFARRRMWFI